MTPALTTAEGQGIIA